jgi:hypothetical protein
VEEGARRRQRIEAEGAIELGDDDVGIIEEGDGRL